MTHDEDPPEELVRDREYQRRKRLNDLIDPRDPAYDSRFDEPPTREEIEEYRTDAEEHDPDSRFYRRTA